MIDRYCDNCDCSRCRDRRVAPGVQDKLAAIARDVRARGWNLDFRLLRGPGGDLHITLHPNDPDLRRQLADVPMIGVRTPKQVAEMADAVISAHSRPR